MIIQALRFQYLTPFGADIFKIELRDYRCPILKFSDILVFPVYFNKKYFFILYNQCLFFFPNSSLPSTRRNTTCCVPPGAGSIFFRVIKKFTCFLTKDKKAFTYPFSMVTNSASQMQSTLGGVAINCERARTISGDAATQVDTASQRVKLLGNAARQISKVTEVITEIAAQTNLLALNATIEAARAGKAGKGFAVVAGEIKSLAGQTSQATDDIKEKIAGIQNSTDDTVQDVTKISEVISEVNEIVITIAAAIEEQSASATEVAQNIEQASKGIGEVNENVAQSSQVSSEIAKDISRVNLVAEDMSKRSTQMNHSAMDLTNLSSKLRDMVSIFKISR